MTDLFKAATESLKDGFDVAAFLHRDNTNLIFLVQPDQERLLKVMPAYVISTTLSYLLTYLFTFLVMPA